MSAEKFMNYSAKLVSSGSSRFPDNGSGTTSNPKKIYRALLDGVELFFWRAGIVGRDDVLESIKMFSELSPSEKEELISRFVDREDH